MSTPQYLTLNKAKNLAQNKLNRRDMQIKEIIEVLAGLEGFIAETAAEGYLQRALKQIEEIATR